MISFRPRRPLREAAVSAYRSVVEQARQPVFFVEYGVPDTLDGRFELICLHAFLFLHRLRSEPASAGLAQAFFDMMFTDMDCSLREIGTGDLSVGRHVKRMAQAFYGRIRAYQRGLEQDDGELAAALRRNLYGSIGESVSGLAAMTEYTRRAARLLADQPIAQLAGGKILFPQIAPAGASPTALGTAK